MIERCKDCGATHGTEPEFDEFWQEWRSKCGNCGAGVVCAAPEAEDAAQDHGPVYYVPVECPNKKCRSTSCPVRSTPGGKIRHHKCNDCGRCFKSIEKRLSEIVGGE